MKLIILILHIYIYQYIFEVQKLNINSKTEIILLNNDWKENDVNSFQLGFYLNIFKMLNEINLLSFSDFLNFNIDFIIKNDHSIFINETDTGLKADELIFFYLKGELINNKIKLTIKINTNQFIYNHNEELINFKFDWIKIILGNNKNLLNFQFEGSISCLCSFSNTINDEFDNMKKCNSKILVYHNFRNNIKNSNYFYNEIENGFSGSINGNNKYIDSNDVIIEEKLLSGDKILVETYFQWTTSFINLSSDFIYYISSLDKISYTIYLSAKLSYYRYEDTNVYNLDFYFYKRNDFKFYNRIINSINSNSFNYEIYCKNTIRKSGVSNSLTYFKIILINIFNLNENNFNTKYVFKTNKSLLNDYTNFSHIENEVFIFSTTDQHYIGILDSNNFKKIGIKIYIFETALIWGSGIFEDNNKLYVKYNDNNFFLFCNDNNILIKNRFNNYYICENDDENGINYPIRYCIIYKNNICYKCLTEKKLINNSCTNQPNVTYYDEDNIENYNLFFNSNNSTPSDPQLFNKNYGPNLKKFYFKCEIILNSSERNIYVLLKLNNKILKSYSNLLTNPSANLILWFELYLIGDNKIEIEKVNINKNISYSCDIFEYDIIPNRKNLRPFENCEYLNNNKNYIQKEVNYMLFECIDKNFIPINYYLNIKNNIILKCNPNCKKCINAFICTECNNNYFLISNNCIKNNDKNCEISINYNKCKICKSNTKFNKISGINNYYCFNNCYYGCNNCNSPLYNQCLSCNYNYLYYPELKKCFLSNHCLNNYKKLRNGINICVSSCLNKDSFNNCLSCNDNLYLNKINNSCDECLEEDGYFKNYLFMDIQNRPICEKCHGECKTCVHNNYNCTSCNNNKFLLIDTLKCIEKCPDNYYQKNNFCLSCNLDCLKCDMNNKNCLFCNYNKYIKNNNCVFSCGNNYFLKENKCLKCINNCLKCENNSTCLKCGNNFYLNEKNECTKCDLKNQFLKINKCFNCITNCKFCKNDIHNCLACEEGFIIKKYKNFSICIKECKKNYFYDFKLKKCINCKNCINCFDNNILNCFNCSKCKKKCKFEIEYNIKGIKIIDKENNNIKYNLNYKINDIKSKNILIKDGIQFLFKNKTKKINFYLTNNLILKSDNCFDISNKNIYLLIKKSDCKIINLKSIIKENNLYINFTFNFYLKNNFKFLILINEIKRFVNYKIIKLKNQNNISFLSIQVFPNYFKKNFNLKINIIKSNIKENSFCNLVNFTKIIKINDYNTLNFETDYEINKKEILNKQKLKIIKDIKGVSKIYKNTLSLVFFSLLFINIVNIKNIFIFINLIQLVYFLELILLLPLDLGGISNSFIEYFKLDFNLELNINFLLKIKDEKVIKKYFENEYLINPKTIDLSWLNILNLKLEVLFIIILNISSIILWFIKKLFLKKTKNKLIKYENLNIIEKLQLNIKIIKFKLIESLFPFIFCIVIVYYNNIIKFKSTLDNYKILMIIFIYYLFLLNYFWNLFGVLLYIKNKKKIKNKWIKLYYKKILKFKIYQLNRYSLYQLFNLLRIIILIFIIFFLNNLKIHVFLFLFIQIIYIIYLLNLKTEKIYFEIQKIRIEEMVNLFLLISIIFNYYLNLKQFQLSFIIFYILIFLINFLILLFETFKNIYNFFRFKLNCKKIIKRNIIINNKEFKK